MMISKALLAVAVIAAANLVLAQVEVVDRTVGEQTYSVDSGGSIPPVVTTTSNVDTVMPSVATLPPSVSAQPQAPSPLASSGGNNTAELYYQMQVMQQELQQLRGMVEQQSNQIKQLKQQRLDDYVDLDRRVGELSSGNRRSSTARTVSSSRPSARTSVPPTTTRARAPARSSEEEIAPYKRSTKLILVEKNYEGGISKLQEHLSLYPKGRYSGNAVYWLGEVYLAQQELDSSKQWFERLLQESPAHTKSPDAKYKLGTVYHRLGDDEKARSLLQDASSGTGNTAKLASTYLKENF